MVTYAFTVGITTTHTAARPPEFVDATIIMTLGLQGFPLFVFILSGQLAALLGTTVTNFSLGIWAYEKAGNVTDFTWIGVASTLPGLLLGPFIGVFIDRIPRKKILLLAQAGNTLVIAAITFLYFKELLSVWWVVAIVPFGAICGATMQVGFTSTVSSLVDRDRLNQANGLIGLAFGLIQLGGPLLGGLALDHSNLNFILIATLAGYGIGILTLSVAKIPSVPSHASPLEKPSVIKDLKEGFRYLRNKRGMIGGLWLFTVVWFCVSVIQILFVPVILGIGTKTDLGMVQTMGGIGLLLGGICMVIWKGPKRLAYGIAFPCFALSIAFTLVPISTSITVLAIVSLLVMMTVPVANAASQTLWQRKTAPAIQGRVFALRNTIMKAAQPAAFISTGYLADTIFEPAMKAGGLLNDTIIGQLWGTGAGRGSALLMSLFGAVSLVIVIVGFSNATIRRSDIDLPDYEAEPQKK